jgi:CRISPR-associated endonuclease Cas2
VKRSYSNRELPDSALKYVLEGLIPYTDANLKLSFSPNTFFNDLENIGRQKRRNYRRQTFRNYFYRAKKQGLIVVDQNGIPRLTEKGRQKIRPYKPQKLGSSAYLLVAFDIPEEERTKRNHLRLLLKELEFTKVQRSLWASKYDHRNYLEEEIKAHELRDHVQVYECIRII